MSDHKIPFEEARFFEAKAVLLPEMKKAVSSSCVIVVHLIRSSLRIYLCDWQSENMGYQHVLSSLPRHSCFAIHVMQMYASWCQFRLQKTIDKNLVTLDHLHQLSYI